MSPPDQWILVGSTGASGGLILQEALRRGHRPVLAGRNPDSLANLAGRHGDLPTVVLDLADPAGTARALRTAPLVLNTAGPFASTAQTLAEAAIGSGCAYLDLSNEPPVTRALATLDDAGRRSGTLLLPGVGFGVVVADCLAAHLLRELPDASSLTIALAPHVGGTTPALAQTSLELVAGGASTVRHGQVLNRPTGRHSLTVPLPGGTRRVPASVTADLLAVHHATGVPNIDVLTTEVPGGLMARVGLPLVGRALRSRALRGAAVKAMQIGSKPLRTDGRSSAWGRAVRAHDGREVQARLDLQDGYVFSAASAVRAVEEALRQSRHHGYRTPSQVFGADFITSIADSALSTA